MQQTRYHAENGPRRVTPGDKLGLTRAESVEAERLRTGHSLLLRSYRKRIGQVEDDISKECEEEEETLEHLLTVCPAVVVVVVGPLRSFRAAKPRGFEVVWLRPPWPQRSRCSEPPRGLGLWTRSGGIWPSSEPGTAAGRAAGRPPPHGRRGTYPPDS